MSSLLARLQKLNKEATPGPWYEPGVFQGIRHLDRNCEWYFEQLDDAPEGMNLPQRDDAALIVECRNSLPAVLNLIEAARHWKEINDKSEERGVSQDTGAFIAWQDFCEAVAVFVSGQEEPK